MGPRVLPVSLAILFLFSTGFAEMGFSLMSED
jgi:hypothetical protein